MVALPAATAVTSPVAFTVATLVLELVQLTAWFVAVLGLIVTTSCLVAPISTVAVAASKLTVVTAILAAAVAGNTAATAPAFTALVAVAPATVKLLAATPVKVQPVFAVSMIFAVYAVVAAKVLAVGDHAIVPEYCAVS
jgi:hypothetical protein